MARNTRCRMTPEPSRRLAPTARWLWRAQGLVATVAALIAAGVAAARAAPGGAAWMLLPVVVLAIGVGVVPGAALGALALGGPRRGDRPPARHGHGSRRTLVPMLRVQHVDTHAGPARPGARARHRRRPHRGRARRRSRRSTRPTRAGCATASPRSPAPPMSSEPHSLHPAAIARARARRAARRRAADRSCCCRGRRRQRARHRRAGARRGLPRARRRAASLAGLRALAQHELRASTSAACTGRRGIVQQEGDDGAARPHPGRSTPWPGRCSACSASSRVHVQTGGRRREGRDRARRGRRRRRSSGCARRCARGGPRCAEAAAAAPVPERRLGRRELAASPR